MRVLMVRRGYRSFRMMALQTAGTKFIQSISAALLRANTRSRCGYLIRVATSALLASLSDVSHEKVRTNSKPCDFLRVLLDFSSENTWHLACCLPGQRISFSLLRRIGKRR